MCLEPKASAGEQLLQLLRQRRLRHAASPDAKQLDLADQRRVVSIVQRADDVVRDGEALVAVELAAGQTDEVRRVETRVFRVDRDEHLHDVIFGQTVEDDRRHREVFFAESIDVGVQRQQPVLAVDRAQNAFALGHLQRAHARSLVRRLEDELLVAGDDDGAGNRRQVARLAALLVVLDELVDLPPDDLALVGLLARRDAPLEEVPVDLGGAPASRLPPRTGWLGLLAVAQDLEADELVDITGGQGGLVELDAELLHPNGGDVDHRDTARPSGRVKERELYRVLVDLYNRFIVS